jgi:hypothetical protein
MKRKEPTQKERFKLQKLLETVLEENGEFYDYAPGWSDVRVAQECGMTSNTVKNTRTKTFGVLYRKAPVHKAATRIVALEAQVAELQTQMAAVLEALTLRDPDLFQPQKSNGQDHEIKF